MKKALVAIAALALAGLMAGTGFSGVTGKSGSDTATSPAVRTEEQETSNFEKWGPNMMYGNNMPGAMDHGMMRGGMHGSMGSWSAGAGNWLRNMWNECRQLWSGHDRMMGPGTTAAPRR